MPTSKNYYFHNMHHSHWPIKYRSPYKSGLFNVYENGVHHPSYSVKTEDIKMSSLFQKRSPFFKKNSKDSKSGRQVFDIKRLAELKEYFDPTERPKAADPLLSVEKDLKRFVEDEISHDSGLISNGRLLRDISSLKAKEKIVEERREILEHKREKAEEDLVCKLGDEDRKRRSVKQASEETSTAYKKLVELEGKVAQEDKELHRIQEALDDLHRGLTKASVASRLGSPGLAFSSEDLAHSSEGQADSSLGLAHSSLGLEHSSLGLEHSSLGLAQSSEGLADSSGGLTQSSLGHSSLGLGRALKTPRLGFFRHVLSPSSSGPWQDLSRLSLDTDSSTIKPGLQSRPDFYISHLKRANIKYIM